MRILTPEWCAVCLLAVAGLPSANAHPSDLRQGTPPSLQITVRSADSNAVPHAVVAIVGNQAAPKPCGLQETPAGVFQGNPAPGIYRVRIAARGWREATLDAVRVCHGKGLILAVALYPENWYSGHRGSVISGRLLNAQGAPLEGADFCVSVRGSLLPALFGAKHSYMRLGSDCFVDSLGAGYFRIWLPYSHHCHVEAQAPGLAIKDLGEFKLKDGDAVNVGDVVLSRKEGIISGQVIRKGRKDPLGGVSVVAWGGGVKGYYCGCTTDKAGRFEVRNLPAGIYSLSVGDWGRNSRFETREIPSIVLSTGEAKNLPAIELENRR